MTLLKFTLVLIFCALANGECPDINDIPIMYDENTFTCALKWYGPGNDNAIQGCNDCSLLSPGYGTLEDGWDGNAPSGSHYSTGSVVVMPGKTILQKRSPQYKLLYLQVALTMASRTTISMETCIHIQDLKSIQESMLPVMEMVAVMASPPRNADADRERFHAHLQIVIKPKFLFDLILSSHLMDCLGFVEVLTCDATDALATTECDYQKTIGTQYSSEAQEHMAISQGVSYEISTGLFDIFSESLGFSSETGT